MLVYRGFSTRAQRHKGRGRPGLAICHPSGAGTPQHPRMSRRRQQFIVKAVTRDAQVGNLSLSRAARVRQARADDRGRDG